jgi:hypothetical protein
MIDRHKGLLPCVPESCSPLRFHRREREKHTVVIEKWRKPLAPAFRKSKYKVFVDDNLTHEIEGEARTLDH